MSGFADAESAGLIATWVAAVATIVVLGGLLGERRLFAWAQHLFAGLVTGLAGLFAIREVIVPWLLAPLASDPTGRPELWVGVALVAIVAAVPWLPRPMASVPISIAVGALAAFALSGAVLGTLLPQLLVAVPRHGEDTVATVSGVAAAAVTGLVAFGFVRGVPRGRVARPAVAAGRWLLMGGIGAWLGYLLLSRLVLLVDRIGFLLGDWLGIGR